MPVDPLHFFLAEWTRLVSSGQADTALRGWQALDASWGEYRTAREVVAALDDCGHGGDRERLNPLLLRLVRTASGGGAASRVAAVLVAARMVPAAGAVVGQLLSAQRRSGRVGSVADARATVAACLWTQIRTYPLSRTSSVAGNLKLEVLRESLLAHDVHPRHTERARALDPQDVVRHVAGGAAEGLQASEELIRVLSWAVTEHVLSRDESDLLLARWAEGAKPVPTRVLGQRLQVDRRTLSRRCARAERVLATAVRAAGTA